MNHLLKKSIKLLSENDQHFLKAFGGRSYYWRTGMSQQDEVEEYFSMHDIMWLSKSVTNNQTSFYALTESTYEISCYINI